MEFSLDIAAKYPPSYLSYAQEGEDLILHRFFERQKKGFYVDVGAHHPTRFSNTFIFYLRGWRGINIEPTPGSKEIFDTVRPEDINLECAIGKSERLVFHVFNEKALNTFDAAHVINVCETNTQYFVEKKLEITKEPLADILDKHMPHGVTIDFLNIDAENSDLEAAQSNHWEKYRPHLVLIENHDRNETFKHYTEFDH